MDYLGQGSEHCRVWIRIEYATVFKLNNFNKWLLSGKVDYLVIYVLAFTTWLEVHVATQECCAQCIGLILQLDMFIHNLFFTLWPYQELCSLLSALLKENEGKMILVNWIRTYSRGRKRMGRKERPEWRYENFNKWEMSLLSFVRVP